MKFGESARAKPFDARQSRHRPATKAGTRKLVEQADDLFADALDAVMGRPVVAREQVQVCGRRGVQAKCSRERIEDLRGRMGMAALLDAQVVVGADAGEGGQFLAT